jgi:hypothetical protein
LSRLLLLQVLTAGPVTVVWQIQMTDALVTDRCASYQSVQRAIVYQVKRSEDVPKSEPLGALATKRVPKARRELLESVVVIRGVRKLPGATEQL